MEEKIEKIAKIDVEESKQEALEPKQPRIQPNKERFDESMADKQSVNEINNKPVSLMDTVRDMNYSSKNNGTITYDTLVAQTQEAVSQIQEIKKVLGTPEIQVKSSAHQLLNNKLTHIDESLKIALSKAGVEYENAEMKMDAAPPSRVNPISRFLGFLTDGQNQLERLGGELQNMSVQGKKDMSPVDMLAVQVKVSQIQQELELFTSLLSKALESVKTIMNIQV